MCARHSQPGPLELRVELRHIDDALQFLDAYKHRVATLRCIFTMLYHRLQSPRCLDCMINVVCLKLKTLLMSPYGLIPLDHYYGLTAFYMHLPHRDFLLGGARPILSVCPFPQSQSHTLGVILSLIDRGYPTPMLCTRLLL